MIDWSVHTVAELQRDKIILVEDGNHGEYRPLKHEFVSDGVPFIRPPDLVGGTVDFSNSDRINDVAFQRVRKGIGAPGDILFSHRATVGRMAKVPEDSPTFVTNPGITFYRVLDRNVLDPDFLYYWMQTALFMDQVWAVAGGSDTFPYASLSEQRKLNIHFPDISVQQRIGLVLRLLDDKIELNRRMSATLEEMARALYRSWFVDFDPVHARALGQSPAHMDATTAALFPDSFGPDGLPKGWELKPAEAVLDIKIGKTPPRKESEHFTSYEHGVPWVSIRDMGGCGAFTGFTAEGLTEEAVSRFRVSVAQPGTVLLSFKLTVGRVCIARESLVTNEAIAHLNSRERGSFGPYFLFSMLSHYDYESLASTSSIATAVNSKTIKAMPILIPTHLPMRAFEDAAAPLMEKVKYCAAENETIAALRDTLLPRLMSGELRVREAEKQVEEVL